MHILLFGVPIIHHRVGLGVFGCAAKQSRRFDDSEEAFLVTVPAQLADSLYSGGGLRLFRLIQEL